MRQDQRRDLDEQARTDRILSNKFGRYLINNLYERQGRSKPWKKPIKCLCKGKDVLYTHGRYVPCGRYKCQQYVNEVRRKSLEGNELMKQRKTNTKYWKELRQRRQTPVKVWANRYGVSVEQATLELQLRAILEEEIRQFLIAEDLRYDPNAVWNRREEE